MIPPDLDHTDTLSGAGLRHAAEHPAETLFSPRTPVAAPVAEESESEKEHPIPGQVEFQGPVSTCTRLSDQLKLFGFVVLQPEHMWNPFIELVQCDGQTCGRRWTDLRTEKAALHELLWTQNASGRVRCNGTSSNASCCL
jgi:hypothetical protein